MPRAFEAYRLSRRAEIDLAEVYAYTTEHWSIDQANRYLGEMREAFDGLVEGVKVGRSRIDVAPGYLSLRVGSHSIFYRITDSRILIARVLHQATDVAQHLAP